MWRTAILLTFVLLNPALAQTSSTSQGIIACIEEKDCLAKLRGKVNRNGRVLTIALENRKSRKFENSKSCETHDEACESYVLEGYRPAQGIYLVTWHGFESDGVILISARTGQTEQVPNIPKFSPSGNSFAAHGGEYDRRVTIWSVKEGEIKQELVYDYDFAQGNEAWSVLGWEGEVRVRFQVSPSHTYEKDIETDAVLKEQGWILNWPFPQ